VLRQADRAWIVLGVYVVAYDVLADTEQTLSEGADRYMLKHPWLTRGVALAVAGHVCNLLPDRYDVIHRLFAGLRAWKR
jgi:hypothetical protein